MQHFTLYFQSDTVVEWLKRWKIKQQNVAEFWVWFSITPVANSFSMLWVRTALGIRLDGTVMHYKL